MFLRKLILSPQAAFAYSLPSTRSSVLLLNAGLCPFAESEEYAAREKNGICKPHDHYLEEGIEKKQLVELREHYGFQQQFSAGVNDKFERIEQLAGLQELYCSHEQRSAEFREKLERTEGKPLIKPLNVKESLRMLLYISLAYLHVYVQLQIIGYGDFKKGNLRHSKK